MSSQMGIQTYWGGPSRENHPRRPHWSEIRELEEHVAGRRQRRYELACVLLHLPRHLLSFLSAPSGETPDAAEGRVRHDRVQYLRVADLGRPNGSWSWRVHSSAIYHTRKQAELGSFVRRSGRPGSVERWDRRPVWYDTLLSSQGMFEYLRPCRLDALCKDA